MKAEPEYETFENFLDSTNDEKINKAPGVYLVPEEPLKYAGKEA